MPVLRPALVVIAVLACAWFALGVRQVRESGRVTTFLTSHKTVTATQDRQLSGALDSAAQLNPDRTVDILRGQLALAAGEADRARRILEGVTAQEPENLQAWVALGYAGLGDQPLLSHALGQIAKLDPRLVHH